MVRGDFNTLSAPALETVPCRRDPFREQMNGADDCRIRLVPLRGRQRTFARQLETYEVLRLSRPAAALHTTGPFSYLLIRWLGYPFTRCIHYETSAAGIGNSG